MNKIVLSYFDSLLRESDIKLLESGNWINDRLIGFLFEYFQHDLFKEYSQNVYFLDPDVVHLIKLSQVGEAREILGSLNLSLKSLLLLPVNDHDEKMDCGGNHWSLLVWDKSASKCEHYDSCKDMNSFVAKKICSHLCAIFEETVEFSDVLVAQQTNGFDCGIYVMKIAEKVCYSKLQNQPWNPLSLTDDVITAERHKIKDLIFKLSSG